MEVIESTPLVVNKSEIGLGGLPSLGLPGNSQEMVSLRTTLLIPSAGNLRYTAQLVQSEFLMAGLLSLPWLLGCLTECLGEGYWLSFDHRLPISYELGDRIFRYLHPGRVLRDNEDAEGEIEEDTIEEEVI